MAYFLSESSAFDSVNALVARSVSGCNFEFFSKDDAEQLSVARITRPDAYDELGKPVANGVHDPRMGVTQAGGHLAICPTCQLTAAQGCLGHMGHAQLHSEVYNPLLLSSLAALLNLLCGNCGKFRLGEKAKQQFLYKFACLARGQLPPEELENKLENGPAALGKDVEDGWDPDNNTTPLHFIMEDHTTGKRRRTSIPCLNTGQHRTKAEEIRVLCAKASKRKIKKNIRKVNEIISELPIVKGSETFPSFLNEEWRIVLRQFVKDNKACSKCKNCNMKPVKFKKDGNTRIFVIGDKDKRFYCTPARIKEYVNHAWQEEGELLSYLYPGAKTTKENFFFVETIMITPNSFRPLAGGAGQFVLSPETRNLVRILESNERLADSLKETEPTEGEQAYTESMAQHHVALQEAVNIYYDSSKGSTKADQQLRGIRQVLERKQGLFRNKMMGKRVNFAARSVISPDNNLEGDEVGIPPHILKTLAYPEAVTPHNVEKMRKLVENGNDVYPGASYVLELSNTGQNRCVDLGTLKPVKRVALAQKLLQGLDSGEPPFVVYRHLVNGDPVLMNRQPTLHKPGIMAHKVRCLYGEKTIRMHYMNCNTYNADFDGDEMNVHAPQDPISRIEALNIALTNFQYLVPTSGKPLRGLIQDHVIGGVFLCARDTFLTQEQASHLLYKGLAGVLEGSSTGTKHMVDVPTLHGLLDEQASAARPKIAASAVRDGQPRRFIWDPPCVWKPKRLWSGKQILSMVLKTLLRAHGWSNSPLLHSGKSKTQGDMWGGVLDGNKEEEQIVIRGTELLCGVLDKSQFGSAGQSLVHLCYEIFGPLVAAKCLTVFAKLFTAHLQITGFTCAMSDFLVNEQSDKIRAGLIEDTLNAGKDVVTTFAEEQSVDIVKGPDEPDHMTWRLKKILAQNPTRVDLLDGKMLGKLRELWGKTIDVCLPAGQLIPFPQNSFAAMICTGAKGSKINHSQISCLMGQQELEGRRVPFTATRRSLPCFASFDYGPRAGGYITDRFLTGIRPQEYFFHCMAGREGLVDTAVKTSRSGYLQRCIVKHLENLVVAYDYTVRDISDNSVVQFLYGEDGLDVMNTPYLTSFNILENNPAKSLEETYQALEKSSADTSGIAIRYNQIRTGAFAGEKPKKVLKLLRKEVKACTNKNFEEEAKYLTEVYNRLCEPTTYENLEIWNRAIQSYLDPVENIFSPGTFFGATSESFDEKLEKYLATMSKSEEAKVDVRKRMHFKFQKSLAQPGEAVGVIAAQGMGEPSTQMTLNTFHLAGHGGANVTLGIPRLREIVQTAARKITTPYMKVFFKQTPSGITDTKAIFQYASEIAKSYGRTVLKDLIREKKITEVIQDTNNGRVRVYVVTMEFENIDMITSKFPFVTKKVLKDILQQGKDSFEAKLAKEVKKIVDLAQATSEEGLQKSKKMKQQSKEINEDKDDEEKENDQPPQKKRRVNRRAAVSSDIESSDDDAGNDSDGTDAASDDDEEKALKNDQGEGAVVIRDEDGDVQMVAVDEQKDDILVAGDGQPINVIDPSRGYVQDSKFKKNRFKVSVVVSLEDCPSKILMSELITSLLDSMYIQNPRAKGLNTLHTREENKEVFIETEGINMEAFWLLSPDCIDHDRLYTNDIYYILTTYGVEACRQAIVNEIRNVFGHYGITVDYRHLYLVADYMTQQGSYRACNRKGMEDAASPFLQMSYETSMNFCTNAAIEGLVDNLISPSGSVVIGSPPHLGSNSFTVHCDLTQQQLPNESEQKVFEFF